MIIKMPHIKNELLNKAELFDSPLKDLLYSASKYIEELEKYYEESTRKVDE